MHLIGVGFSTSSLSVLGFEIKNDHK